MIDPEKTGFKVVDNRGEQYKRDDVKEQKVVGEAKKPKLVLMRRCPTCKSNRPEVQYLFNPSLQHYVCPECGAVFMDVKFVKQVWKVSMEGKREVDVKDARRG